MPVPTEPPPVYVLVLDELPQRNLLTADGDLDASRYPTFAALAERSTWYTNWTVHSGRTIHSVPALLSGVLPRNVLATPDAYPTNLPALLGDAGWGLHVAEHNSWLCPPERCAGVRSHPVAEKRQPDEVLSGFLDELESDRFHSQTLHVLHLVLPHPPWVHLPDGTPTGTFSEGYVGRRWPTEAGWVAPTVAEVESLWQLGHTDAQLARWIAAIEARGDWDDALVVVTADHGEDLAPGHNSRDIGPGNHGDVAWVPTFVKLPGQHEGAVVDEPRTASELAGIVLDAIGLPRPAGVGEHHRVVVTDRWPYDEGAQLRFGPVDESARPHVTGAVTGPGEGAGWDGLVDEARRATLSPKLLDVIGRRIEDPESLPVLGRAMVDHLDELRGSARGGCGWDATPAGSLVAGPDERLAGVALAVDGVVVGVSPVQAPWPGAPDAIAGRASYFRVLLDPDDVPRFVDVALLAVDGSGVVGRYELAPSPVEHAGEMRCPTPLP